jgi:hypothetical protein
MSKAEKRNTADKILHLERSIRRFGDRDGKLQTLLDKLRQEPNTSGAKK